MSQPPTSQLHEVARLAARIIEEMSLVIEGKPQQLRTAVTVLLAEGHLLIEDVPGVGERVIGGGGELHAPGLTATTSLDLCFHHHRTADFLGDRLGVRRRFGDPARGGRDMVLGEQFLGLILEKIHELPN